MTYVNATPRPTIPIITWPTIPIITQHTNTYLPKRRLVDQNGNEIEEVFDVNHGSNGKSPLLKLLREHLEQFAETPLR